MAEKKTGKKYQFLAFGLCSLVALAACMVVLVVTVRSVENSNSSVAEYETKSKTELSGDAAQLLDYLKKLTEKTSSNKFIKADTYTDISVDDSLVSVCDMSGSKNETDKNILLYTKNKILPAVDTYYGEDSVGVFGTVSDSLPIIDIDESDIEKISFSVGQADESGNPVYNTDTGELVDGDYYFITLNVKNSPATESLFSLDEKQKISEKFIKDISSVCAVSSCESAVKSLTVYSKINRLTDEIEYIDFEKVYDISADVDFSDSLELFGSKKMSFEYKVNKKCEYSYAGISFSEASVTVEPDGEAALSVNAVIENDSKYTVTFVSSDTSVATVDEMGYVKGIKPSDKPVTVTVILEYLGEKFTDECTVYVSSAENKNG